MSVCCCTMRVAPPMGVVPPVASGKRTVLILRRQLRGALLTLALGVALVLPVLAHAAAPGRDRFDTSLAASVWGKALGFMAPRTLKAYGVPRLALWGMSGLTALDPNLAVQREGDKLVLFGPDRVLFAVKAPKPGNADAWGSACAAIAAHAVAASATLGHAGTQGVIRSFFDELFNHFDPYSRYEPPDTAKAERAARLGGAGLGITLGRHDGEVVAATVAPSSPAFEAGVSAGMTVLAIGGTPTDHQSVDALQSMLAGPSGTSVTLTIRPPKSLAQKVTLTRAPIPPQTVFASERDDIAILRITDFDQATGEQFAAALGAAMAGTPSPKGIIVDLRNNRGGVLRQAVLSVDALLAQGTIIRTEGRDPAASHLWHAEGADLARGLPVVIMVDGVTASAAEVFSAALADNDRAVVIGTSTLGKGLVQNVTSLPGGGELFVTWSRMIAPRDWPLQGLGVMPQVCLSLGSRKLDRQIMALKSGHDLLEKALENSRAARPGTPVAEILAIREACPASVSAGGYFRTARTLISNSTA